MGHRSVLKTVLSRALQHRPAAAVQIFNPTLANVDSKIRPVSSLLKNSGYGAGDGIRVHFRKGRRCAAAVQCTDRSADAFRLMAG
ncbi:MAG TPA: hypothetical protein VEY92_05055, partial [Pseudoxanthomonas sp.]|nr:hypothetical protein [Pseudoxanthomonas sp.]